MSEPSCSSIVNQITAVHEITSTSNFSPVRNYKFYFQKLLLTAKKKLNTAFMKLFIKDLQPFSVVEDIGFKEFVNILNPGYKIPNHHTHFQNTFSSGL